MVEEAGQECRRWGDGKWGSVTGEIADVCALPFADGSFDIVISAMAMLYHAPDKGVAVSEIARVLMPDGRLIVTTNGAETMKELKDLSHKVFGTLALRFGRRISSAWKAVRPSSEDISKTVEVSEIEDLLRVTDAQDIVNYLRSFSPGEDADETMLGNLDKELAFEDGRFGRRFPRHAHCRLHGGKWP